jgi:transposase-like protein
MMEFSEQAEGAVLRYGAAELASLLAVNAGSSSGNEDAVLSAAVATETLERYCRYRRTHERGFYTALQKLHDIRELRNSANHRNSPDRRFQTESQCIEWLKRRLELPSWRCARCGSHRGGWLAARQRWQCTECKRQQGLRCGTIMERSPLPLVTWFLAIRTVLTAPEVRAAELAETIGLARQKTVQSMITKIQGAIASPQACELLAGLDATKFEVEV